jgi:hypothetical protein
MMPSMKLGWLMALLGIVFSISGCGRVAAPPVGGDTPEPRASEAPTVETNVSNPILKTALGDLEIVSARFVDEVNGTTPGPEEKILLVILDRPGVERLEPSTFSLEAFQNAIHLV